MTEQTSASVPLGSPWWRYKHVWLIIGLLTFAVAASFGLLYASIVIMRSDPVYSDPLHPQDGSAPKVTQANMLPAEEARNHAATGGVGAPDLLKPAPKTQPDTNHEPLDD